MDHKWGRNVSDWGFTSAGCTMAARILTLGFNVWITNRRYPFPVPTYPLGAVHAWILPPNSASPELYEEVLFPRLTDTNFPYGWNVGPDVNF